MVSPKTSLQRKDAVLVVDVQVDFCPGGALPIEEGDRVVPVLNEWIRVALDRGLSVYLSRDWHPDRHVSFRGQGGRWPAHCLQDSEGARFHPDLLLPEGAVKVTKGVRLDQDQNSAFDQTGLAVQLEREGVRQLWIGGLAQDVCVLATVLDARRVGLEVCVILDGTRPVNRSDGRRALESMRDAGARIETTT
jgi:nicotinamidase/pyrazinamidase